MKLIGITGHAGVGKDTVASYIYDLDYTGHSHIFSFADPLKQTCAALFDLDIIDFYESDLKELKSASWGISPRQMLQFVGTEVVRNHMNELIPGIGETFWIHHMKHRLDRHSRNTNYIIVPDIRMQDEYEYIYARGGVIIHLTRPGYNGKVGIPNHSSEAGIEFTHPSQTYSISNSGDLYDLRNKIDRFLIQTKLNIITA